MEQRDIYKVCDVLRSNWRFMFEDKEQCLSWYTYLKDYPTDEVNAGVVRYILNYTKEPTVADIIGCIRAGRQEKRRATPIQMGREIRCIHCRDTGLIVWEDDDGRMYGRPCKCEKGVQNYATEQLDS